MKTGAAISRYGEKRSGSGSGFMSLFIAAFVIPFLFFLFSFSLDLSKYYAESQQVQKIADDAALYAYRFLPYSEKAAAAARNFLGAHGILSENAAITADGYSVSIALNAFSRLNFARFFGMEAQIPMTAYARAWGSPLDVFIAIDRSTLLAPDIPQGIPWGDSAEWPAAEFFEQEGAPLYGLLDPRILTQRCFNPAFSAVKGSAIRVYDYFSVFPHNAIGVGFYPGTLSAMDLARPVLPGGVVADGMGEADFGVYQSTAYSRHEWCAAVAQNEIGHLDYRLPEYSPLLQRQWDPENGRPGSMINPVDWSFNIEYQPYLQAREVIWSRTAEEGSARAGPSISGVLREALGQLFGAALVPARRALAGRSRKTAIILAADVPWQNLRRYPHEEVKAALREELGRAREQIGQWETNIRILYVLFRHPGNGSPDLDSRVEDLQNFLHSQSYDDEGNNPSRMEIELVFAPGPRDLEQQIPALILLERKSAMLAR